MKSHIESIELPAAELHPHPSNANTLPDDKRAKLKAHIERTGRYPAVIVRQHEGSHQILDGHHRAQVLVELGHETVRCEVWDVDEQEALILLGTLNRLSGEDDVRRRARLIQELGDHFTPQRLAEQLPENSEAVGKLLALTDQAPALVKPPAVGDLPSALTFFLREADRRAALAKLRSIDADRSRALLTVLGITGGINV